MYPVDPNAPKKAQDKEEAATAEVSKSEPTGNVIYDYRVEMFESLHFSSGEAHLLATQGFEHQWIEDKAGLKRCYSTPVYWGHVKKLMESGASHGDILAMYV